MNKLSAWITGKNAGPDRNSTRTETATDASGYSSRPLEAGTNAPEFSLKSTEGDRLQLGDLRGRPVIIAFYPGDWSPVCGDQLTLYNEVLSEFERYDAQLMGISVDNIWSHRAFAENRNLRFPLLSDFEPKGEVARRYGVYDDKKGECRRALFVLDSQGTILWSYVAPNGVNPGADGILRALESLD